MPTIKSSSSSEVKYRDKEPTKIRLEDGSVGNYDKDGRFSIAYMKDGSHEYQCDNKKVDLQTFFGATAGKDSIPNRVSGFSGIGEGTLRRSYESDEEYEQRITEK